MSLKTVFPTNLSVGDFVLWCSGLPTRGAAGGNEFYVQPFRDGSSGFYIAAAAGGFLIV
jgi:hypothetical protein